MKIEHFFVSGYKNLVDCTIDPNGLHAITGCNSSGKSNLLEVIPFLITMLSGSDDVRQRSINEGFCPFGFWVPIHQNQKEVNPFRLEIECRIQSDSKQWQVKYQLEIMPPTNPIYGKNPESGRFLSEVFMAKQIGTPGISATLVRRMEDGTTIVADEKGPRNKDKFKTRSDMSALRSLEVREADDFPNNFPLLSNFMTSLLSSNLIRLDPEDFRQKLNVRLRPLMPPKSPGEIVLSYDPYHLIEDIQKDKKRWNQFIFWLKEIGEIEKITLFEFPMNQNTDSKSKTETYKCITTFQHGRPQFSAELSMGGAVVLGFLIALYSFLDTGGIILFEEPENHLHPQAIEKMITMFREFADQRTILFSTHSPVVINSMKPSEITVMRHLKDGFVTTQKVSDNKEAIEALNRNFFSLGDLLQKNFESS